MQVTGGVQLTLEPPKQAAASTARSLSSRSPDWLTDIRNELDEYHRELQKLGSMPSGEVLQTLSSMVARVYEIRHHLYRSDLRLATAVRTREVDPMIEELKLIYTIQSRLISDRRDEWEMAKGQY